MDKIPDPKMRTKKFIFCHCKFQGGNPPSPPIAIGDHNKKTTNVFFLCTAAATVVKNLRVCLLMMMVFLQKVSVVGVQKIELWSLNTILQWSHLGVDSPLFTSGSPSEAIVVVIY
jgi:hypothetical protein